MGDNTYSETGESTDEILKVIDDELGKHKTTQKIELILDISTAMTERLINILKSPNATKSKT